MESGEVCGPPGMEGELVHVSHHCHQIIIVIILTSIETISITIAKVIIVTKVFINIIIVFIVLNTIVIIMVMIIQVGFTANSKFFWQFTSCHQVLYGDGRVGGGNDDDDFCPMYIFKYALK